MPLGGGSNADWQVGTLQRSVQSAVCICTVQITLIIAASAKNILRDGQTDGPRMSFIELTKKLTCYDRFVLEF